MNNGSNVFNIDLGTNLPKCYPQVQELWLDKLHLPFLWLFGFGGFKTACITSMSQRRQLPLWLKQAATPYSTDPAEEEEEGQCPDLA